MVLTFDSVAEIPKPAKTSVSPRSSPLGTLRAEERRFSARNVPSGEERGELNGCFRRLEIPWCDHNFI